MRRFLVWSLFSFPLVACSDEGDPISPGPDDVQGDTSGDTQHSDTADSGDSSPSDTQDTSTPSPSGWQLRAGMAHACAWKDEGALHCWGKNNEGQLGDNSTTRRYAPVATTLTGIQDLALGNLHSCAIIDESVRCWGNNEDRQLGNGTSTSSLVPVAAGTLKAQTLAAGTMHTCALDLQNQAWCWGSNGSGQLGDGERMARMSPHPVVGPLEEGPPLTFSSLGLGANHSCAIDAEGQGWCWGGNDADQIPIQPSGVNVRPVSLLVPETFRFSQVVGGSSHSCLLEPDGRVRCWAGEREVALANSGPGEVLSLPVSVTQLSAGLHHTCALGEDQSLYCWGDNTHGQLGQETENGTLVKVALDKVHAVAAGGRFTCALHGEDQISCWGDNREGQLGIDEPQAESTSTPTLVRF